MRVKKMFEEESYFKKFENLIGYNDSEEIPEEKIEFCRNLGICEEDIKFFLKYSSGGLNECMFFMVPVSECWEDIVYELRREYLELKELNKDNEKYKFDFYPAKGGLVPWAKYARYYDYNTIFYWRMTNENKSMIVVYAESEKYYEYEMTIAEFVYKLVNEEIPNMYEYLSEGLFSNGFSYYDYY